MCLSRKVGTSSGKMKKNITIIGAGLVGSLLSIYLSKRGYKVKIYERRGDMRRATVEAGRSINLALSDRGLLALEKVGLVEEIRKISIPMHGRFIHNLDGTTAFQPYGKEGQFINSVSRGELNKKLMDLAEEQGAEIHFHEKCSTINWKENEIEFTNTKSGDTTDAGTDIIFGADGAFSAARLQHQLNHDKFDYHQYYIDCGYKELTIPAAENGNFLLEKNALHIWPRKDYMLIALPNLDGSFTCTLFFPFEGEASFSKLDTEEKVKTFFGKYPKLKNYQADVEKLYRKHQFHYIWFDKDGLNEFAGVLYNKVNNLGQEGVQTAIPYKEKLDAIYDNPEDIEKANLDIEQRLIVVRGHERESALVRILEVEDPEKAILSCPLSPQL